MLELSPRAFEFFAGDLLEYLGLASVEVTRQTGDGGIDAVCEIVSGGLFHVPTGVQVKRQRQNVGRPEIDRFIGALSNRFACGIFVTTAKFGQPSLQKAAASVPHVSTIDGDQVAEVLTTNGAGITPESTIDEVYFGSFEERVQSRPNRQVAEETAPYTVTPAEDLISLRALSYVLHVDTTTIRDWIARGRLRADETVAREGYYFERRRVREIRETFRLGARPGSSDEWVDEFLRFATRGKLNKSYKPVMLLAILDLVESNGTVDEDALARAFLHFYTSRASSGLPTEVSNSILSNPNRAKLAQVKRLLVTYPLDRFIIKGYLTHLPDEHVVRIRPEVWEGIRYRAVVELRRALQGQIDRYYAALESSWA